MRRTFTTLLIAFVALTAMQVHAQTGIRMSFLDFESTTKRLHPNIMFGLEKDVNDKISFAGEILYGFNFDPENLYGEFGDVYTNGGSYALKNKFIGFQYRSSYFITEVLYVGSTIGYRSATVEVTTTTYNASTNGYSYYGNTTRSTYRSAIIPLGIRMGLRSELDGWYNDLYVGLGIQLGGRNKLPTYIDAKDRFSALWLNVGYAFGIGW